MHYHTNLRLHFQHLIQTDNYGSANSYHNENYKNEQFGHNIQAADLIMFVLYDELGKTFEKLQFVRNSDDPNYKSRWFSAKIDHSNGIWNYKTLKSAKEFTFNSSIFELTTKNDVTCEEVGFLKLTCDRETKCDQFKWWLTDPSLLNLSCGIVFSKESAPVNYRNGSWSKGIQILTYSSLNLDIDNTSQ